MKVATSRDVIVGVAVALLCFLGAWIFNTAVEAEAEKRFANWLDTANAKLVKWEDIATEQQLQAERMLGLGQGSIGELDRLVDAFRARLANAKGDLDSAKSIVDIFRELSGDLDSLVDKLTDKPAFIAAVRAQLDSIKPGTIVEWGGRTPPGEDSGWLLCDGRSLERNGKFNALFRVIRTAWGAQDDEHFNVPDLRGLFLRGADDREASADRPDPDCPRLVGSTQDDATGRPRRVQELVGLGRNLIEIVRAGGHMFTDAPGNNLFQVQANHLGNILCKDDVFDPETRPTNAAVHRIIKY